MTATQDTLIQSSSEAAVELIKQDGWSIVNELAKTVAHGINNTALVVLPVKVNLEEYKTKLVDPIGFEAKFNTLCKDVGIVNTAIKQLFDQHESKSGTPTPEDIGLINILTLGYSKIQGHLENAIHPLMLNLVDDLEAVGITELKVEG